MAVNSVRQKGRPRLSQNVENPRVSIAVRKTTHRTLMQLKRRLQRENKTCTEITFDDVIAYLLSVK